MTVVAIAELAARADALVLDVRRQTVFRAAADSLPGAVRRDPALAHRWAGNLPKGTRVVVACVHGHQVSQGVAKILREAGIDAAFLEGGIEAWRDSGRPMGPKPDAPRARWITRERPKIDRVACPWLIARFLDPDAEFLFAPSAEVLAQAHARDAEPYDLPGVPFSHVGEKCSFDAFVERYGLDDPALLRLAPIVRGADTGRPDLAPEAAGLLAMSLGLSAMNPSDDRAMLRQGFALYDALHAWAKTAKDEKHGWPPKG